MAERWGLTCRRSSPPSPRRPGEPWTILYEPWWDAPFANPMQAKNIERSGENPREDGGSRSVPSLEDCASDPVQRMSLKSFSPSFLPTPTEAHRASPAFPPCARRPENHRDRARRGGRGTRRGGDAGCGECDREANTPGTSPGRGHRRGRGQRWPLSPFLATPWLRPSGPRRLARARAESRPRRRRLRRRRRRGSPGRHGRRRGGSAAPPPRRGMAQLVALRSRARSSRSPARWLAAREAGRVRRRARLCRAAATSGDVTSVDPERGEARRRGRARAFTRGGGARPAGRRATPASPETSSPRALSLLRRPAPRPRRLPSARTFRDPPPPDDPAIPSAHARAASPAAERGERPRLDASASRALEAEADSREPQADQGERRKSRANARRKATSRGEERCFRLACAAASGRARGRNGGIRAARGDARGAAVSRGREEPSGLAPAR